MARFRRHVQPFDLWCLGIFAGLLTVCATGLYLGRDV